MRTVKYFVAVLLPLLFVAASALALPNDASAAPAGPALNVSQVVDQVIQHEKDLVQAMKKFHPMVETYIQNTRPDNELGSVPISDKYYLGRLDISDTFNERFYTDIDRVGWKTQLLRGFDPTSPVRKFFRMETMPIGFASMVFPDARGFDRQSYYFQFLRREFLGDIRCLVFQIVPKEKTGHGRFLGRIWVEDKDFNVVRFNGTYTNPPSRQVYFHMDSWRQNVQPGVWLPAAVYSEESDPKAARGARFKSQTRLWAYDLRHAGRQEEFTQMLVEQPAGAVKDESDPSMDWSPVMSLRAWQREAEDNVLERIETAGLLAPPGPVDKVLETVVNNLQITNNLDIQPEVRCRVLLTSPLESFTVGHTIIISRGLIDVLPDEASLAMVLSHELAHIALGELLDTKYSFGDRMWFADQDTFMRFNFQKNAQQEQTADTRAIELLKSSPYRDKLANAGLFLRQLGQRAPELAGLTRAYMGDGLTQAGAVVRMRELMTAAPELQMRKVDQVAALPLGGRIKVDPWDDHVELMKTKTVQLQSAREKMPFEIAPVIPHLTRTDSAGLALKANGGN